MVAPIIIAVGVILTALVYLIVFLSKKQRTKTNEAFADIAEQLGAKLDTGDWKKQPVLSGKHEGIDYEITLRVVQAGNTQVTYLDLRTPFASEEIKLTVRRLGFGARLFKSLGLSKRIDTGDSEFDSKVLVKGTPESRITPMAYDLGFKTPALYLIGRGFSIELKPPTAVATKIYNRAKDLSADVLRADIDAFARLLKRCR